jgi:hypothetical protein
MYMQIGIAKLISKLPVNDKWNIKSPPFKFIVDRAPLVVAATDGAHFFSAVLQRFGFCPLAGVFCQRVFS